MTLLIISFSILSVSFVLFKRFAKGSGFTYQQEQCIKKHGRILKAGKAVYRSGDQISAAIAILLGVFS